MTVAANVTLTATEQEFNRLAIDAFYAMPLIVGLLAIGLVVAIIILFVQEGGP